MQNKKSKQMQNRVLSQFDNKKRITFNMMTFIDFLLKRQDNKMLKTVKYLLDL